MKKTTKYILLFVVLYIIILVGLMVGLVIARRYVYGEYSDNPIAKAVRWNKVIKESGFSQQECEVILQALDIQQGVKRSEVLDIKKINETQAEIMTGIICGPICGNGKFYIATKIDGEWKVEYRSFWVS